MMDGRLASYVAVALLVAAFVVDYGSRRLLQHESMLRFVGEKIISRALGLGALILFVLSGLNLLLH